MEGRDEGERKSEKKEELVRRNVDAFVSIT